jgi:hypothetical protein
MRSVLALASIFALPLGAQDKGRESPAVPQSAKPPAGLCQVWLKDVPAGRQPAPTDCATAVRNRPANAQVVFGDLSNEAAAPRKQRPSIGSPARTRIPENQPRPITPPSRSFVPAGPPAGGVRGSDPSATGRNTPVGTMGPVLRPADPPPPKAPQKPLENPQS